MAGCTHSSNREEDLNKEACESMSDVFVLHFEEVVATLMQELHTGLQLLDGVHLEQANSGTFWWQETEEHKEPRSCYFIFYSLHKPYHSKIQNCKYRQRIYFEGNFHWELTSF